MASIVRGDNTAAFGGNFLTISITNNTQHDITITKAVFVCGPITKTFENPVFPLTVNLTEAETAQLECNNTCYLAVWDEEGRKLTCQGSISFNAQPRKV